MSKQFGESFNSWEEMQDGYGIEEVPKAIAKGMICITCGRETKCKLYTDVSLPTAISQDQYRRQVEFVKNRVWCKDHAIEWFKD